MLNKNGESGQPCVFPDFNGNSVICSPFKKMLALGLSYIVFIVLGRFLLFLVYSERLRWKGVGYCQRLFMHVLRGSCGFCPCFCLYDVLCLWIYVCWTIIASLEWNWLGHGVWSFWYVEFCLPVFCWESLHLYSLNILVYNSLFWLHLYWVLEWV
jgi:hypothetical protein